jgi:chemotaxis receptor (MCP) glutamine deamidase CheD
MHENFEVKIMFPVYTDYTNLRIWDKYVKGKENDLLRAEGIFYGLAITLYDPKTRRGVVAHISGKDEGKWHPENVIDTLLKKLSEDEDIDCKRIQASLTGESISDLFGMRMSAKVENKTQELGINLIGKDLGKWMGEKIVFLHCNSGKVEVYRI